MTKIYKVYFKDELIGTTHFEYGDPPMGVVHGLFYFAKKHDSTYDFIKQLYLSHGVKLATDNEDIKLLSTLSTDLLTITNDNGQKIKGVGGNQIGVLDNDDADIFVFGIDHQIYKNEFLHHLREYENKFS